MPKTTTNAKVKHIHFHPKLHQRMDTVEDDLDEESQDEAPYTQSFDRKQAILLKLNVEPLHKDSHVINLTSKSPSSAAHVSCLQKSIEEEKYEFVSSSPSHASV